MQFPESTGAKIGSDASAWRSWMLARACTDEAVHAARSELPVIADARSSTACVTFQDAPAPPEVIANRAHAAEAAGLRHTWILRVPRHTVTFHRDVLYDGAEAITARVQSWVARLCVRDAVIDFGQAHAFKITHTFAPDAGYPADVACAGVFVPLEEALATALGEGFRSLDDAAWNERRTLSPDEETCYTEADFCDWQIMRRSFRIGPGVQSLRAIAAAAESRGGKPEVMRPPKIRLAKRLVLDADQRRAVRKVQCGHNVVIQGAAGSGKSATLAAIANSLERIGLRTETMAFPNSASIDIEGITMHDFLGLRKNDVLTPVFAHREADVYRMMAQGQMKPPTPRKALVLQRMRSVACIIIDEISMVRPELLSIADVFLKAARGVNAPFGGAIVVLVGDVVQLPPVSPLGTLPAVAFHATPPTAAEWRNAIGDRPAASMRRVAESLAGYAGAECRSAFRSGRFRKSHLSWNHRQDGDEMFQSIVEAVRTATPFTRAQKDAVLERCSRTVQANSLRMVVALQRATVSGLNALLFRSSSRSECTISASYHLKPEPEDEAERDEFALERAELFERAEEDIADALNGLSLAGGQTEDDVAQRFKDARDRDGRAHAEPFEIPVGAKAMLTDTTDRDDGMVKNAVVRVLRVASPDQVEVERHGRVRVIRPHTRSFENQAGSYETTYIPLRPAYACTVHKVQGQTLPDGVTIVVDLVNGWWPFSVGYTALTRAKRLQDVSIVVQNGAFEAAIQKAFAIDPAVREFYQAFVEAAKADDAAFEDACTRGV